MNATPPKDELLKRYAEAKTALPDGLPLQPSLALRERILQAARDQINATEIIAPHAVSTPATALKSIKNSAADKTTNHEAANDSFWYIRALGSLAVMGLAGLLWWQFEHGTPEEQLAAKSAQPSVAAAKAEIAPPTIPVAPAPAPASAHEAVAAATADALIAPAPQSQAKIAAKKSAPSFETEKSVAQKETVLAPTPEAARARVEESAPVINAAPAAHAHAPAARAAQQTSKSIAESSANTTTAPLADYAANQNAPSPAPRAAPAAAPRIASPAPAVVAPAAAASVIASPDKLFSAIEAKDASALREAIAQGASPNANASARPDGNPALTQAVVQRWSEGVSILLLAGANREAKNKKGYTAIDVALDLGLADMAQLLATTR